MTFTEWYEDCQVKKIPVSGQDVWNAAQQDARTQAIIEVLKLWHTPYAGKTFSDQLHDMAKVK